MGEPIDNKRFLTSTRKVHCGTGYSLPCMSLSLLLPSVTYVRSTQGDSLYSESLFFLIYTISTHFPSKLYSFTRKNHDKGTTFVLRLASYFTYCRRVLSSILINFPLMILPKDTRRGEKSVFMEGSLILILSPFLVGQCH